MKTCCDDKVIVETTLEAISRTLQQGLADWNPNPKTFQAPVQSRALNQAIADIAALARFPLEEMIYAQQEQIQQLQEKIKRLERLTSSEK